MTSAATDPPSAAEPQVAEAARGRLELHARTVSLLTLLSRVTGLGRDAVLSRIFGVGPVMDAFAFAFMLPNLFRRLFGEGALSAAFLPVYARLDRERPQEARQLAALLIASMVAVLGATTVAGELALWAVRASAGQDQLTVRLMMLTLPYMPLVCLVAVLGAMLQVHGRFGPTAAAPIILNLAIMGAALGSSWLPSLAEAPAPLERRIVVVALAVTAAGVAQVTWSWLALRRLGVLSRGSPGGDKRQAAWAALREVLTKAGPMILGLGVLQLNTFIDGLIASWPTTVGPTIFGLAFPLEPGALATLGYAQRLYEFPLGVFGIAVATAIFPLLSRQAHDAEAFMDTLRRGLRLVAFIGFPASVGLIIVSAPLTAMILQGGDFTAADTQRVAFVLAGYAPAVWAYSANHTLTRAFYARGEVMTPVRIAMAMVVLNFLLNVTLIWTPLREAGLAWSTAICAVIQTVVLTRTLSARLGAIVSSAVRRSWLGTLGATAAMAAMTAPLVWWLAPNEAGWGRMAMALCAGVATGAALFAGIAWRRRMPELAWALGRRA